MVGNPSTSLVALAATYSLALHTMLNPQSPCNVVFGEEIPPPSASASSVNHHSHPWWNNDDDDDDSANNKNNNNRQQERKRRLRHRPHHDGRMNDDNNNILLNNWSNNNNQNNHDPNETKVHQERRTRRSNNRIIQTQQQQRTLQEESQLVCYWHPSQTSQGLSTCAYSSTYPAGWTNPSWRHQFLFESHPECCRGAFDQADCGREVVCETERPTGSPTILYARPVRVHLQYMLCMKWKCE